jgi:hypothetical protein
MPGLDWRQYVLIYESTQFNFFYRGDKSLEYTPNVIMEIKVDKAWKVN